MTVSWQPGFSKDGSALCMCVCTRVRVCVLHGTRSSYSVTNSLPNERQRIVPSPWISQGLVPALTSRLWWKRCYVTSGDTASLWLSVALSLSVFPLSLSFHFPCSFPSSLCLSVSGILSSFVSSSLTLSLLPSSWSACPHKPIVTAVRSLGHMERSLCAFQLNLSSTTGYVSEWALCWHWVQQRQAMSTEPGPKWGFSSKTNAVIIWSLGVLRSFDSAAGTGTHVAGRSGALLLSTCGNGLETRQWGEPGVLWRGCQRTLAMSQWDVRER